MSVASMSADSELDLAPSCPFCGDRGLVQAADSIYFVECSCRLAARRRAAIERALAKVPPRFRSCSRESWRGAWPLDERATGWPAQRGKDPWAIVLLGPPGVGKTHVATAIWTELVAREPLDSAVWTSAEEASERSRQEIAGGERGEERLQTQLREADLLLLDDVGRERATPFALELVRKVLHHRHAWQLPTIVTANASQLSDFDVFDPALTSRLREGTMVYLLAGSDWRKTA